MKLKQVTNVIECYVIFENNDDLYRISRHLLSKIELVIFH